MTVILQPGTLTGEIAAMPSKSDLHRLMLAARLAGADIDALPAISEDIAATKACLYSMHNAQMHTVPCTEYNCRESGSTLRFLLPVIAALGREATFTGEGRLPERPMQPLVDLLRAQGCTIDRETLPITISGKLQPGKFALAGDVSSQFVTGLLFALPLLEAASEITLTSPLESRGYADMTLRTLRKFGIIIKETATGFKIPAPQRYLPPDSFPLSPESDWSNAAFWLAANALGSDVRVTGLDEASAQPDRAIARYLPTVAANQKLAAVNRSTALDASQCPDLVPIMAVVMALTPGRHEITNAARLRIKESDRLHAMAVNLNALGAEVTELPDGLVIRGKPKLRGGEADSFGDHRIAMALAITALKCEGPVTLRGAEAVRKSYPAFWEDYFKMRNEVST
ncbi:MAG: 3-phosphoshikimate 1-carboxyvinyltransferase [Firmicutes bacterium]|nr:3-phosphoshikimate 1-carboxyvinyltransferase [Bacillota bacterium]